MWFWIFLIFKSNAPCYLPWRFLAAPDQRFGFGYSVCIFHRAWLTTSKIGVGFNEGWASPFY